MITIRNFAKKYQDNQIITHSSLIIPSNKITFLMGENGAGKTSFIKCLTGLEDYSGEISYSNQKNCLVIWDDTPLYNDLSGLDNLVILGQTSLKKPQILNLAQSYLDNDLLKRKVKTYSYGQRKKLSLALIELLKPDYLIMDEISNGLDFQFTRELKSQLIKLTQTTTILLTGHQFDFYNDIIDTLLVFENKQIVVFEKHFKQEPEKLETIYDSIY